jgi:hypothetical protein
MQRVQHTLLDNFFSVLSCVVSVPFYTGFLPLLFWVRSSALPFTDFLASFICNSSVFDLLSFFYKYHHRVDTASWLGK